MTFLSTHGAARPTALVSTRHTAPQASAARWRARYGRSVRSDLRAASSRRKGAPEVAGAEGAPARAPVGRRYAGEGRGQGREPFSTPICRGRRDGSPRRGLPVRAPGAGSSSAARFRRRTPGHPRDGSAGASDRAGRPSGCRRVRVSCAACRGCRLQRPRNTPFTRGRWCEDRRMASRPLAETLNVDRGARLAAIGGGGRCRCSSHSGASGSGGRPAAPADDDAHRRSTPSGGCGRAHRHPAGGADGVAAGVVPRWRVARRGAQGGSCRAARVDPPRRDPGACRAGEGGPRAHQGRRRARTLAQGAPGGRAGRAARLHARRRRRRARRLGRAPRRRACASIRTVRRAHRRSPGSRLEDDAFYAALADPGGYRAAVPPAARYAVFLNKADRPCASRWRSASRRDCTRRRRRGRLG